jgi:signal transduction histidine kinase
VVTDDRVGSTAGTLILVLAAMAIGNSVRTRREHLADLMERANALARDRDRQAQLARAAERSRIAREMHDVVAHSLSVMITLADGASVALDRAPDRSRAALTELTATGRAALRDMRRVLGALAHDDAPLEPTGRGEDFVGLIDRFRTAGLPVRAEGLLLEPPADTGLRLALYRVVQESLTNVLRHAPGTARVDVSLRQRRDDWEVTIADQGGVMPAPESEGAGLGLVGMRERVELFGGTVEAGPSEHGWRVHVTIPHQEVHP